MSNRLDNIKREDVKVVSDDIATVIADMIAHYEQQTGKKLQPAHIERLLINTFAYRDHLRRQETNEAWRQQHPRYATGLMLDIAGDDVNTPRLGRQPAHTRLKFSIASAKGTRVLIPKGCQVSTGSVVFATTLAGTIPAGSLSVELPADCTVDGDIGNGWAIGQVNQILTSIDPDVSAQNVSTTSGGIDTAESDDAYRKRILLAPESFSVAGTRGAYEYWARQASQEVYDVTIGHELDDQQQPIGGTVKVTITTRDGMPSDDLCALVERQLSDERVRVLCDTVTCTKPYLQNYQVTANLTLLRDADEYAVKQAATRAWQQWSDERRGRLGKDIVPLEIQSILKVPGVYNVETPGLSVIDVAADAYASCTQFTLNISGRVDG